MGSNEYPLYGGSMRKYARFGRELRKLTRQAKICTPPGGEVIAKICVLRSKDLYCYSRRDFATDASYVDHFFLSPPSGGGYVSHREFRRRCYQNNRVPPHLPPPLPRRPPPPPRASSPLGARLRKFALPTPRYGQLAKICTGNLSDSGLRKYALRQNHTIPA